MTNSKYTKLTFMDCNKFVKELRIYLFSEELLEVNSTDPDMDSVGKLTDQHKILGGEVMKCKLNLYQDWENRIHFIGLGCQIAMCDNGIDIPFDTKLSIDEQQTKINTKDPKIRFLWEAYKISDKFSDLKNLDSHFLYNEFDGTFYKFVSKLRDIMKSLNSFNCGKTVFMPFIFEVIECIVTNNIDGYGKLNIEKYLNRKHDSGDNLYNESEIEDITNRFNEIELIGFVKLSRELQEQMRKDANS